MTVSALDAKTALVVIDLQRGIVALQTAHPPNDVIANAARLARAFRTSSLPVVLVNVATRPGIDMLAPRAQQQMPGTARPADFSRIVDEMEPDPERDILITKRQWGAFYGTELDLQLRRRKITGIVLCGIATSIGVESTARDAYERGYNLTFASDAMTDMFQDAHDRALARIFPRIGEIATTDEILAKLIAT